MVVSLTYEEDGNSLRWYLRRGEKAVLGNSPWCDFVLPTHTEESSVCCTLHFSNKLLVEADFDAELQMQNVLKDSLTIQSNDTFHLKQYPIAVKFVGVPEQPSPAEESNNSTALSPTNKVSEPVSVSFIWCDYSSVPQMVLMSESGKKLFLSVDNPKKAIDLLVTNEHLEDAVRGLAGMLPLDRLLNWCISMLDTSGIEIDSNKRNLLKRWQSDPLSVSKNEMSKVVPWSENASPWTHLLAAVSWVEPNQGSPQTWCPASTRQMIVASIIASLQLATASVKAEPFRRTCVERGLDLLLLSMNEKNLGGSI
ncbi:MAG: hypothetical protein MUC83_04730 [Pirellula sp.]|jgi:hypothetical protein|nr:hypothetical protein [Pirellula sp.]